MGAGSPENASILVGVPQSVPFSRLLLTCSSNTDQVGPAFYPWGLDLQKNSFEVGSRATVAGWGWSAWSRVCPENGRDVVRRSGLKRRGFSSPETWIGRTKLRWGQSGGPGPSLRGGSGSEYLLSVAAKVAGRQVTISAWNQAAALMGPRGNEVGGVCERLRPPPGVSREGVQRRI